MCVYILTEMAAASKINREPPYPNLIVASNKIKWEPLTMSKNSWMRMQS